MARPAAAPARNATLSAATSNLATRLCRRPAGVAAVVYLLVAVIFIGPALLPGKTLSNSDALWFEPPWVGVKPASLERPSNAELGDAPRHLQLFLRQTADALPRVPLWNPAIVAGRPFEANAQSAVFGPYTWPAYVLPFWTALGWIAVLKLWAAAFGTFLLARSLGMRFGGALLAGFVFALNLKLVTWLSYPAMSVWTLIPWLLLLTDRVVRRPDLLSGAGLAAVVGVQFLCGHPESSFHALLAAVAFLAMRVWQVRREGSARSLARPLLAFAAAAAAGAALAAVTLIPFGELLLLSADVRDRAQQSVDVALPFKDALGIFMPDYWGRPTQAPVRPFLLERALYVGALPLMLSAVALIARPVFVRVCVALFGALWLAVALGVPPFLQVITRLPVFSSGHNSRLVVITMLCVALLAGWGLEELSSARRFEPARRRVILGVAALLLIAPLAALPDLRGAGLSGLGQALGVAWLFADQPLGVNDPFDQAVIGLSSLALWLSAASLALALLALRFAGRLGVTAFVALALVLACADLFRAGMGYNPAIDRDVAEVPRTAAIRLLEQQGLARFASTAEIPQNVIAMRFGPQEARGYDLPIVKRFDRLWRSQVDPRSQTVAAGLLDIPLELRDLNPRSLRALRLLGVTHVLQGASGRAATPPFLPTPADPPLSAEGLTPVYRGPDARVYRIEGALPRAFVVGSARSVDGEEAALRAVSDPAFDGRRTAIAERALPALRGGPPGRARILSYEPERVVIRASSPGPGLLVLADTWYPGWKAKLDGREVPVERVDYLLRGVAIGPGRHAVEFSYEPLSWLLGRVVSLVALAGLLAAVLIGVRRRRARQPAATPPGPAARPRAGNAPASR